MLRKYAIGTLGEIAVRPIISGTYRRIRGFCLPDRRHIAAAPIRDRSYAQVPLCLWAIAMTSITGRAMDGRKRRNNTLLVKA